MKAYHHDNLPFGFLLVTVGLFIRFHIGRRRFNRRGIGGLQQFPTYGRFIFTMAVEKVIYFIGTLCLWAGLVLLALAGFNHLNF
jgi:hypothetical protein